VGIYPKCTYLQHKAV